MIVRMSLGVVLSGVLVVGAGSRSAPAPSVEQGVAPDSAAPLDPRAPAAWIQDDPADSLYRAAREALDRRDYRTAADLFAQVPVRYPRSGYAADSYYWRAFALYRLGGTAQLKSALAALDTQQDKFPKAATNGDARALARRIQGELARQGDPEAVRLVRAEAESVVQPPVPPVPPVGPVPPTPPTPPTKDRGDDRCSGDDDDTKLAALNALLQMDDERARPILQRVLARKDAGSVCLRRKAVFLIAQEGTEGTEDILLETARTDPDQEVREQAVFWLSQVGSERAVGALDSILRTSKDPGLQEKAVFALSQHDSPKAGQALRAYAERPDLSENVREKAIFWIGQRGGKDNEAFLRSLYGRLKEVELRNKVLFSLSQMGGPENIRWLLGVVKDSTQPIELRKQALFWAGQGDAPIADLASIYSSLNVRELREQVIFVYSQRDDSAAVDRLLEIARRDPDTELRKKALFWLGQSSDPRAAKAIQDIIEQP
ncbi:MAG TPA: HEAT repeat domain-containing protein [Gemmatimonadales bacterium]|nr:HEAT repeat domain-containing protein [Gemmatimonadales bacterium]